MDELKELWNKESDEFEETHKHETPDLYKESNSIIARMRKRIRHEDKANYIIIALLAIYFAVTGKWLWSAVLVVAFIPVLLYYRYLIKKLDFDPFTTDVNHFTKKTYKMLRAFVLRYRVFGYIIIPISFVFGFYIGLESEVDSAPVELTSIEISAILITSFIIIAVTIAMVEGFIHLLYGRLLKQLRKIVESLEEEKL